MDILLHKGQQAIFNDPHKFRIIVCGRRFGKSRLVLWELLLAALNFPGTVSMHSPERVLGILPTLSQAKKILWEPLYNVCTETEISKFVKNISKTEFRVDFEGGKPSIVVAGALDHAGDRLRGMRLYFVAADEIQNYRPTTWDEIIVPAMADTPGSRAIGTGTPLGTNNILHTLAKRAETIPDLYSFHNMPTWTNPTIPREEVENARRILPPRAFRQEFEAHFLDFPGKIFSELEVANQVPFLPTGITDTIMGYDFGDVHPAIVIWGKKHDYWYYLDGWSPSTNEPVALPVQDDMVRRLAEKYHPKAVFCDPSRPSAILNLRDIGRRHGVPGLTRAVEGYNRIEEGIDQLHSLIFQRKLQFPQDSVPQYPGHIPGLLAYEQFSNYHRLTNIDGVVTDKVKEGQDDHIIDASRYALAMKKGKP